MKNLMTRKIVLGMLMTLVLAFGVQGIADALTLTRSSSGDLEYRYAGQTFNVNFSVSGVAVGDSVTITVPAGVTLTKTEGYDENTRSSADTTDTTDSPPEVTLSPNIDASARPYRRLTNTTYNLTFTVNSNAMAGTKDITVSGGTNSLEFTIYVVEVPSSPTKPTFTDGPHFSGRRSIAGSIEVEGGAFTGTVMNQISEDIPVTYSVSGGGTVYVRKDDRESSRNREITTSSAAPVWIDMNRKTNTVTVRTHVTGYPPDADAVSDSVTVIYEFADIKRISGHDPKQIGGANARLNNPFVVQLTDAAGGNVSGVNVRFAPSGSTGVALERDPAIDEERSTVVDVSGVNNIDVETDSNGRASVYLVLGNTPDQDYTATASFGRDTETFTATARAASPASSIRIASGDGQRADQYGEIENPLVVVVRDQRGQRLKDATVRFVALDGGELVAPTPNEPGTTTSGTTPTDAIVDVDTDQSGEASVRYSPPDTGGRRTVRATIKDTDKSVTFTINGTPIAGQGQQQQDQQRQQRTDALSFNIGTSITGNEGDEITIEARATDRDGIRVRNVPITFTLSDSDAGSLSVSSDDTNSNGIVRTILTLGDEDGTIRARATGYDTAEASITIEAAPTDLEAVSGSGQTGTPGSTLSSPFVVRFEDDDGEPISGAVVTFTVETGGGSLSDDEDTTDSDGEAETTLTLGSTGTRNTVRASVSSTDYPGVSSVTFTADAALAAESVIIAGGDRQIGQVGRLLDEDLSVQVVDRDDNGISGVLVRFRITDGRGRLSRNSDRTDPDGYAEIGFTPTADGEAVVEAYSTGLDSAFFTITTGEPPSDIVKVSGDNQTGRQGTRLANPLVVEVVDENDDPVSGVTVSFRVTAGGGSVSPESATTNNSGRAQTQLTLGEELGENTVTARVTGVSSVATFTATSGSQVLVRSAERPPMYWVSRAKGKLHRLVGEAVENLAADVEGVTGIAVDTTNNLLYFSVKTGENRGAIRRSNLNGGSVQTLRTITAVPNGIALDAAGETVYWTNSRGRIQSIAAEGSTKITNHLQNLPNPSAITVSNGFVYWSEPLGRIRRVSLTARQGDIQNIATGLGEPLSLSIAKNKIYWVERDAGGGGSLQRSNLDGSNVRDLKTFASGVPTSIAVDGSENKIYWTKGAGKIQRSNLAGRFVKDIATGLMNPSGIALNVAAPVDTPVTRQPTQPTQPTTPTTYSQYDVNQDGKVDNVDVGLVAAALFGGNPPATPGRLDVNSDGELTIQDLVAVSQNTDNPDAPGAPVLAMDLKGVALDFDRVQEEIEMLLASDEMSIATQRLLLHLQHLLVSARPDETVLLANYPNPFNPETWIPYHLSESTDVRVNIYDAQGALVRELILGHQTAGYYTSRSRAAYWDGRNALGERVASGIYFYQLQTDAVSPMRKMVILK